VPQEGFMHKGLAIEQSAAPRRSDRGAKPALRRLRSLLRRAGGMTSHGQSGRVGAKAVPRSLHFATAEGAVAPVGMTYRSGARDPRALLPSQLGASGMT